MAVTCPKCHYRRLPENLTTSDQCCPRCGVMYAKVGQRAVAAEGPKISEGGSTAYPPLLTCRETNPNEPSLDCDAVTKASRG